MTQIYFTKENDFLEVEAKLSGVMVEDMTNFDDIVSQVGQFSLLEDDPFVNHFLMYVEEYKKSCAILSILHVDSDLRGNGVGKRLVTDFQNATKDIEFKFLFTRNHAKQRDGFDLETFYNKQGFVTVYDTDCESWMINKESYEDFKEFFGL